MEQGIKRGEVYWIEKPKNSLGSEQMKNRPGLIVSNNDGNENSPLVTVVYLTSQEKPDLEVNVTLGRTSSGDCEGNTVICNQIYTIAKSRVGEYMTRISDEDMEAVDKAIMISLDLDRYIGEVKTPTIVHKVEEPKPKPKPEPAAVSKPKEEQKPKEDAAAKEKIMRLQLEVDFYRSQYEAMLGRIMQKAKL